MKEEIIKYFKDKLNSPSILIKAIKTAPVKYIEYLNEFLNKHKEWEKISYIISGWCKGFEPKLCKVCKVQMTYSKSKHHDYCSKKCVQLDKEIRNKIENTCLEKYGEKCPTLNKDVLEKRNNNNLKKFGTKYPIQLDKFKEKRKKTNIERYGGIAPACSNLVLEKIHETCFKRFGKKYMPLLIGWNKILQLNQYVTPQFTFKQYFGYDKIYKWKCIKCR